MVSVIKKDQNTEPFCGEKIKIAVNKAAFRCDKALSDSQLNTIVQGVLQRVKTQEVSVAELHEIVIAVLSACGLQEVADSYAEYRYYKTAYAKTFEKLRQDADDVLRLGDRENANFDSALVSTKGSLIKGFLTKSLYKQFYLSKREKELIQRGDIYIHDLRDLILGSINCCLFDMASVLKNGFEMSNVHYTEPKSVLTALQVIGDITLVASAQQFGGFTIPEIDKTLLPYCLKTFSRAKAHYEELQVKSAYEEALKEVETELRQGFQSLELKLNTVPSSRGDFAFTTLTFGEWEDEKYSELEVKFMQMIGEAILKTRMKGHGGKQVVFPKLVYLYDKNQKSDAHNELFKLAVECSSKCMYPDYLSLTSEYGTVSRLYKEQHTITSPMGCRAYLSPWKNEKGEYVTIGRCNIGAVSLNVPLILKVAQTECEDNWKQEFWNRLDDCLEVIRKFLQKRYDIVKHQKCSSNPLAFTQGGFYEGYKGLDDEIGDLIRYMTASFGITALDEATYLWSGKRKVEEGGEFSYKVLRHIQEKINEFKKEDGYLYALYATPAESLCATQAQQYAEYCKTMGLVNEFEHAEHYSPEYFTNSFHLNVTEEINPFVKQDDEFRDFHACEGGHIQYVRLDNPENTQAVRAVIERGMDMGFYQGVNFDAAYCNDCHKHSSNVLFKCPYCGSENLTVISRVCGYLGYSNVNGHSRMNDGKMEEIKNRVSM